MISIIIKNSFIILPPSKYIWSLKLQPKKEPMLQRNKKGEKTTEKIEF